MTGRIFSVRLNLDDMAAGLDTLDGDKERSAWLRGFQAGCRGAACRWDAGTPAAIGHALGMDCYADACAAQVRQSGAGKASAEARARNRRSTAIEPVLNRCSTADRTAPPTAGQPIQISMNPENEKRTPPPCSDVSPREDYQETAATTAGDGSTSGENRPQTAAHRFRVVNTERIRRAVRDRDLPGILAGFSADPKYLEWPGAVIDMSLAAVVALLGWSVDRKYVIRAPSGFRKVREAWESLDPDERKRIGREQCQRYGVTLPTTPPQQAQEASA